jgi:hypothetical protein
MRAGLAAGACLPSATAAAAAVSTGPAGATSSARDLLRGQRPLSQRGGQPLGMI